MNNETILPGIVKFNIDKNLAKNILQELKSCDEKDWGAAQIISNMLGETPLKEAYRNSDILNLTEKFPSLNNSLDFELNNILFKYRMQYMDTEVQMLSKELWSALRYNPGGYYKIHCDTSPKMYRTVSCLVYLNPEEYEGGETFFKYFDLNYKPQEASVLIFPSAYIYAHSAMPISKGIKYVLTNWYNDLLPMNDRGNSFKNISILNKDNLIEIDGQKYFKVPKGGRVVK